METNIPKQIIVPVYYFIDEDKKIHFDLEEMTQFFENELHQLESGSRYLKTTEEDYQSGLLYGVDNNQ
jgi:predicted glycosyltransferase involved in capsule biosynthesis